MKAKVQSKEYIEKWLEDNGYKLNSFGWEVPTGEIGFTKGMFDYYDKEIDVEDYEAETYDYYGEEWAWLKEWLIIEVETKYAMVKDKQTIMQWLLDNKYTLEDGIWFPQDQDHSGFNEKTFELCDTIIKVYIDKEGHITSDDYAFEEEWLIFTKDFLVSTNEEVENDIKPNHYKEFGIEVKEIIKFVLEHADNDFTPYEAFCVGNELKYRLRAGFKGEEKMLVDMNKAMEYYKYRG